MIKKYREMTSRVILRMIICFCLLSNFAANAKSNNCLDCKILYELFSRTELKKYYHLDIHLKESFKIIDQNRFFPNSCSKKIENRELIISHEIINKTIKQKPLPLVFEIENIKTDGKKTILSFRYDYEGVVGNVTFNKKNKVKKIKVWER